MVVHFKCNGCGMDHAAPQNSVGKDWPCGCGSKTKVPERALKIEESTISTIRAGFDPVPPPVHQSGRSENPESDPLETHLTSEDTRTIATRLTKREQALSSVLALLVFVIVLMMMNGTLRSWHPGQEHTKNKHVVASAEKGVWMPAEGYEFVNEKMLVVRWNPGVRHRRHPHIVAGLREDEWEPEPGYEWHDKGNLIVQWQFLSSHPKFGHIKASIVEGQWVPDAGYVWKNDSDAQGRTAGAVRWQPGFENRDHPHVIAYSSEGQWEPAPGYVWSEDDSRVARYAAEEVKWMMGASHPLRSTMLAIDIENEWIVAPGYDFVGEDGVFVRNVSGVDLRVLRWVSGSNVPVVRWTPGLTHPLFAHVIASSQKNIFVPEQGYIWVNREAASRGRLGDVKRITWGDLSKGEKTAIVGMGALALVAGAAEHLMSPSSENSGSQMDSATSTKGGSGAYVQSFEVELDRDRQEQYADATVKFVRSGSCVVRAGKKTNGEWKEALFPVPHTVWKDVTVRGEAGDQVKVKIYFPPTSVLGSRTVSCEVIR